MRANHTRIRWVAGAALLLAVPPACVRTHLGPGEARVSPNDGGPPAMLWVEGREYALSVCRSGDQEYFFGVDLSDAARTTVLRVLIDPMDGPRLRVTRAAAGARQVLLLGSGSCRTLEAEIRPTGWWVNRVRDFSGFVKAECTGASGQEVRAEARFTHCH